jgi:hypothetical protein
MVEINASPLMIAGAATVAITSIIGAKKLKEIYT